MTKVKICGLTRLADIDVINRETPDYVGFVFAKSRRQVTVEQAAALRGRLHPNIPAVGVFADAEIAQILALVRADTIQMIQLHGTENQAYIECLRAQTTAPIIKAVAVMVKGDAQRWQASPADYLLLDNVSGGMGQRFDWDLIGKLEKPYFLAGGLNAQNVTDALKYEPFAVDVSSGVEAEGIKDPDKIKTFIKTIKRETYP